MSLILVSQNALMTFEEEKLEQAIMLLKDMERECASEVGWLKSMRSKVFRAEETTVGPVRIRVSQKCIFKTK